MEESKGEHRDDRNIHGESCYDKSRMLFEIVTSVSVTLIIGEWILLASDCV